MITQVKWNSHKVLGNLLLDFRKPSGEPYKTVIFAGENGCGKTTILNTLSTFLNVGSFEPFDFVEYLADGKLFRATPRDDDSGNGLDLNSISVGYHYRLSMDNGRVDFIDREKRNSDKYSIYHYGCVYSKARSGFKTSAITTTKTSQLNSSLYDNDSSDDFTVIKQLLVDIESQDKTDWMNYSFEHPGEDVRNYQNKMRLFRFRKAFNDFFETIKFDRIVTEKDGLKIMFSKNNKSVEIDSLSTGEQQVVFRGTQLLRNSESIKEGIVFIDEPELSMHPKWQNKILDYYRNLFKENGNQTVQMFFSTHSEAVIKSAVRDDDVLVIVLKNENGTINSKRIDAPITLPSITSCEINYLAFDVLSIDYHIALFGYLQSTKALGSIKDADDYIKIQPEFNASMHTKVSTYTHPNGHVTRYDTLPVYIRNAIDHPDSGNVFTDDELRESIKLLIQLCR